MSVALLEPFAGISGDMTVGAFLDLGMPLATLREGLAALPLTGYEISSEKVRRGAFEGTSFTVRVEEGHPERTLADVTEILEAGSLPERVHERARRAFDLLAAAEAKVHGVEKESIHFHEVGGVDAIVDVVGAALGLEHFGVEEIVASRVRVGTGEVECRHGRIPVPAPATVELLTGRRILIAEGEGETTTPTGAVILAAWSRPLDQETAFRPDRTGHGAGSRDDTPLPNLLRVTLGEIGAKDGADTVVEIQANIDDQSPETLAHAVDRLMEAGALDAWTAPIVMKKGRPGLVLTALAKVADVDRVEEEIFRETTTFGVRRSKMERTRLERHYRQVTTPFGVVRVKVGLHRGRETTWSPEYEDCVRAAREKGVSVKEVYAAAIRAL